MELRKKFEEFDLVTPENEKHFVKMIFFKPYKTDRRWHICLPELTNNDGFQAFCGLRSWAEIDTQNTQRLFQLMDSHKDEFCERCAEELCIAETALKALGYFKYGDKK